MKQYCFIPAVIIAALIFTGCSSLFAPGTVENGIYTDPYGGFGCRLDENWVCSDAPESMGLQAVNESIQAGIQIIYTPLRNTERIGYLLRSEEQEVDSILARKAQIIQHYETDGIAVSSLKKEKIDFLGEEHFALHCEAAMDGIPYYILQLHNFDAGAYGITLTFFSFHEDHTREITDLFFPIGK